MSSISLHDCIRATPSRTLAAVARELFLRVHPAIRRRPVQDDMDLLSDRALADIGLSRTMVLHGAATNSVHRHGV